MTPEEAKKKAYESVIQNGEEKIAILLKEQYANLGILYNGELASPTNDAEYRRMAGELLDKRQFNAKKADGTIIPISLINLDQKLDTLPKEMDGADIRKVKGVASIGQLVPTREQLKATAKAVSEGVEEETGTIGFLGGVTFMQALMGFLQWIGGLFSGESSFSLDSIKKSIASVTAESMSGSVESKLQALRAGRANDDMDHILSQDNIKAITGEVRNTVLRKGGVTIDEKPAVTLETAQPVTVKAAQLDVLQQKIEKEILTPEGKAPLQDTIAAEMTTKLEPLRSAFSKVGSYLGLNTDGTFQDTVKKSSTIMASVIAKSISTTITDPEFRDNGRKLSEISNPAEFAEVVSNKVKTDLLQYEKENKNGFKLPVGKMDTPIGTEENPPTLADIIKDKVKTELSSDGARAKLRQAAAVTASATGPSEYEMKMAQLAKDPKVRPIGTAQSVDLTGPLTAPLANLTRGTAQTQPGVA